MSEEATSVQPSAFSAKDARAEIMKALNHSERTASGGQIAQNRLLGLIAYALVELVEVKRTEAQAQQQAMGLISGFVHLGADQTAPAPIADYITCAANPEHRWNRALGEVCPHCSQGA